MNTRTVLAKWEGRRVAVEIWVSAWGGAGARLLVDDELRDEATRSNWSGQLRGPLRTAIGGVLGKCESSTCGHLNRAEARFCGQCGTALKTERTKVPVLAEVEFTLFGSKCRIAVDGEWIVRE